MGYFYGGERKKEKKDSLSNKNNLSRSETTKDNSNSFKKFNKKNDNEKTDLFRIMRKIRNIDFNERKSTLIGLQETYGNQYTQKVVAGIHKKTKISAPGDVYEQEADRVAEQIIQMPEPGTVQRKCPGDKNCPLKDEEKEKNLIHLKTRDSTTANLLAPDNLLNNGVSGQPLDKNTKYFMESRLGYDLGDVRIHTDTHAAKSSDTMNAKAFTVKNNIFFGKDEYSPESTKGKKLLAHELVHTVQQTEGASMIQRTIGDGHDLNSPRFKGDSILEACYDDKARLTRGAQGESVRKIQQALSELGYDLGPANVDGIYGNFTWNAVKQFKSDQKLGWEWMGDVGPGTMGRLDEIFKSPFPDLERPPKLEVCQALPGEETFMSSTLGTAVTTRASCANADNNPQWLLDDRGISSGFTVIRSNAFFSFRNIGTRTLTVVLNSRITWDRKEFRYTLDPGKHIAERSATTSCIVGSTILVGHSLDAENDPDRTYHDVVLCPP